MADRNVIEQFLDRWPVLRPRPHTMLRLHPKNTREELALFWEFDGEVSRGGPVSIKRYRLPPMRSAA